MSELSASDIEAWKRQSKTPLEHIFAPIRNGGIELGPRPPIYRQPYPDKAKPLRDGSLRILDEWLLSVVMYPGPQTKEAYDFSENQIRQALVRAKANPPPKPMTLLQHEIFEALDQEVRRRAIVLEAIPGPTVSRAPVSARGNVVGQEWRAPARRVHIKHKKHRDEFDIIDSMLINENRRISWARGIHQRARLPTTQQQLQGAFLQEPGSSTTTSALTSEPLSSHQLKRRGEIDRMQREVELNALKLRQAQSERYAVQKKEKVQSTERLQSPGSLVLDNPVQMAKNMQHDSGQYDAQRAALETLRLSLVKATASQSLGPCLGQVNEQHIKIIEWFTSGHSLKFHGPTENEWVEILKEVRSQPGCDVVARWPPTEASDKPTTVLVVEWENVQSREEYITSPISTPFYNAIGLYGLQSLFMVRPLGLPRQIVLADAIHDTQANEIYEICTAYFPNSMSVDVIRTIEWIDAPHEMVSMGALARSHGWADGQVRYQGRPARRMIYIAGWKDEEAQQKYYDEVVWPTHTTDGRKMISAMDSFMYELEDQGMLGFERQNFRLQG